MIEREEDLHQHILGGIGVIHAKIEAFPRAVHKFELISAAEKSDAQLFQSPVKCQMPLDPVWDAILRQCVPDPFKFRRNQMLFQKQMP